MTLLHFRQRKPAPQPIPDAYDADEAVQDWEQGYARVLEESGVQPSTELKLAFLCGYYAGRKR